MDILTRMGLKDKVAVVNGTGLGMGRACCVVLAEAGANIVAVNHHAELAEAAVKEVRGLGRRGLPVVGDMLYREGIDSMVKAVLAEFGTIDILVSVLGATVWTSALEMTEEEWDLDFRRNLKYVWLGAKAVAQVMIDQKKKGSIVSIASISGTTASTSHMALGAAKAALMQVTKTLAVEWGPYNIRVNAVAPGLTLTPRVKGHRKDIPLEKQQASDRELIPLGRGAEPMEQATAVLFLASDLASYVTGQTLIVDGGVMLKHPLYPVGGYTLRKA